jgi:hypothetical protein
MAVSLLCKARTFTACGIFNIPRIAQFQPPAPDPSYSRFSSTHFDIYDTHLHIYDTLYLYDTTHDIQDTIPLTNPLARLDFEAFYGKARGSAQRFCLLSYIPFV